jgi:hypothetical protein
MKPTTMTLVLMELLHTGIVSIDMGAAFFLKRKLGQLRFLSSAALLTASLGAVVCTTSTSDRSSVLHGWLLFGMALINLAQPIVQFVLWMLVMDMLRPRHRPWGAFGLVAIDGSFRGVANLRLIHFWLEPETFVAEALFVALCSFAVLGAFYQARWFDRSLICMEDPEAGWLESDERLRSRLEFPSDTDPLLATETSVGDLGLTRAPHGPTSVPSGLSQLGTTSEEPSLVDFYAIHAASSDFPSNSGKS